MTTTVLDDIVQQLLQALPGGAPAAPEPEAKSDNVELAELRRQMAEMQKKLDQLGK